MPEGDTVWRTAHHLDKALRGQPLTTTDFRVPAVTIHSHLKMEGSWHLYKLGSPWRAPGFQARVVLANAHWQAVGFRLGTLDVVPRDQEHTLVGHLGPDLLGADWDADEALARVAAAPEVPIGEA